MMSRGTAVSDGMISQREEVRSRPDNSAQIVKELNDHYASLKPMPPPRRR
jgi:hypothetical protein